MSVESDIKELDKRVKVLEQLVKTLMTASTVSKVEAAKMISEATRDITKQASELRHQGVNNVAIPRQEVEKVAKELKEDLRRKLEVQHEAETAQLRAERAAERKAAEAAQRAMMDKAKADIASQVQQSIEQNFRTVFDSRLKAVEAMTRAALAKP